MAGNLDATRIESVSCEIECRLAANNPTHREIMPQAFCVIHIRF
jgi:hypothetical protein